MAPAVFEGTNAVNAKGRNGYYRPWCKDKNVSVEQRVKALVSKKNRKSPPLEIARKCQISKSTVA